MIYKYGRYGLVNKNLDLIAWINDYNKDVLMGDNDLIAVNCDYCFYMNPDGNTSFYVNSAERIYAFKNGFARIMKKDDAGQKYGYINEKGQILLECIYDDATDFSEKGVAVVAKDGKYGIIDKTGKEIIQFKYDYICEYNNGRAKVFNDGKYGYLNPGGREIIKCKYDSITDFKDNDYAIAIKDGKEYFINRSEKVVSIDTYLDLSVQNNTLITKVDGLFGCVNKKGKQIIEAEYLKIDAFDDAIACYKSCTSEIYGLYDLYVTDKDGKTLFAVLSCYEIAPIKKANSEKQ